MRRVQWGSVAILAALFIASLCVCAPTLRIPGLFSWLMAPEYPKLMLELGLDLQGGVDLTYQVSVAKSVLTTKAVDLAEVTAVAKEVITDRIDMFGVTNSTVQVQGEKRDQIRIQVPTADEKKQREIKDIVRMTHLLQFNEVLGEAANEAELDTTQPDTIALPLVDQKDQQTGKTRPSNKVFLLKKTPEMTGEYVESADCIPGQLGEPEIHFEMTGEGSVKFGAITQRLLHKQLAIVLGGKVYMAPVIQSQITSRGQITGKFDLEEARRTVKILRAGALPAELSPLAENFVGPSLGEESIRSGLRASLFGGLSVIVVMILFYKISGVFANICLALNLLLQLTALVFLGATLTLPGIAGFALTVGMAVDSNVLIFERIKEELRAGKTVRASIDAGYGKALWTILDSNITTILTGVVLYHFGTGPIRGFAVTLIIGLVVNLFTSIWGTRVLQDSWYSGKEIETMSI